MFYKPTYFRHPDYWAGVRDLASVATGIGAWGLMTGVAMVKSGMSPVEAVAMTLFVFAGSAQLAAIPLIAAGAPLWVILATAFCVNLRFVVFSAHLRPYVMHLSLRDRLITGYLTADLSYVFFAKRYPHAPTAATPVTELVAQQAYLAGNTGINWVSWMGASLVGIALANAIPTEWGLGFAGILALLGVMLSLASSPLRIVAMAVSGAAAVVAWALPLKLNIVVAIGVAVGLSLLLDRQREGAHHG
ncbi:MAG: AzlC family ABC transporter permease [Burkholderiaceae bacterium]